jgi:hypothetical protein
VTLVGYTPEFWVIQNSWGKLMHYNGYVRLAMGNTLGICSEAQYPSSKKAYSVKPSTEPFNFDNEFANDPNGGSSKNSSSSTVTEGINLNYMIGSKFYIFT